MMNTKTRTSLLLPAVALFAASCGGGGGGGGAANVPQTTTLQGTLQMPQVAPQIAPPATGMLEQPMVPGEVVVWMKPGRDAASMNMEGFDLVRTGAGRTAIFHARCSEGRSSIKHGARVEDSVEKATCDAAEQMKLHDDVMIASPNYIYQATVQPNDTYYQAQWHYDQINMPQTWDLQQGSSNVIVAVLDTGIVSSHPEFAGRLVGGYDMISDPQRARDGDGRDPNPEDVGDLQTPQGSSFHGTHCAGTIGANGNDGQGVAGVDWNCKLMNVRCLGQGGGTIEDIANAILWAAGLPNATGTVPPQRADIISMSLGGPGLNPIMQQACDQAAAAGVLLVAAAGNDNTDQPQSPAAFDSVLSVGATDIVRQRAPYSNFSPTVDLWAPGGDMSVDRDGDGFPDGVLSTIADDNGNLGYTFYQGTSMACPHVAGVAALLKAQDPSLTASELRQLLIGTAVTGLNLPNQGRLVDAFAAVQAAQQGGGGGQPNAPALVAAQSVADFGADLTELSVRIENRGTGDLVLDGGFATPPVSWLSAEVFDVTANDGIDGDELRLSVDRTGLPNGVEQTTITLNYLAGGQLLSVDVAVRLQVGQSTVTSDTVFVLLVDPVTFETKYQTETSVGQGFSFAMQGVVDGTYLLVAGTDRDNDDFLGDAGELFGAFPSLDQPIPVQIVGGRAATNLSFALQETVTVTSFGLGDEPADDAAPRFRRLD